MSSNSPLQISRCLLAALGTRMFLYHENLVPQDSAVLVVSNHRSFMDAPILMAAMNRPIRFACHHYMDQVPVMRDIVKLLGCFPLDSLEHRQQSFFRQASELLQSPQVIGVFPEGGEPMVQATHPQKMREFHRGFAHLALRAPIQNLAVLPVAIASCEESNSAGIPLKLLSLIDPSEPLFDQNGWHPLVIYHRVNVLIGRPRWVKPSERQHYRGKDAKTAVADLTHYCHTEIDQLLTQGCY
ncbi:MAG TPA: lysophospholipid acyltransferase family protein [Candidatus Obscuribacterales bacterium]